MNTVNIIIKNDYYAYITCDDIQLFNLIKKSFIRKIRKYNNYYRMYEEKQSSHFTLINNGSVIKIKAGLVDYLCRSFDSRNIKYLIQDNERYKTNLTDKDIISQLSNDVTLKYYQKEAVTEAIRNSFCTIQLPTGTGKTEVAASIIRTYLRKNFTRSVIYVVPTIKLQKEAEERFEKYSINCNIKLPIQRNKVNILTYACLVRSKIDYKDRDCIGCLIFDECHHLKASKSSKIVHNYKKLNMCIGLSATVTTDADKKYYLNSLSDEDFNVFGSTGKLVYFKPIEETIDENFVTPIKIQVLSNPENIYLEDYEISDWHILKNKVLMSENRANLVAEYTKYIINANNLNTVCLLIPEVKWSQQYMLKLAEKISDARLILMYGQDKYDEIIDGKLVHLNNKEKQKAYSDIKNPQIKTIFSATSFMYEGIDITNMQALINVYGGRSTTRVKQQAGRVMRLFKDKQVAYIHEIQDNQPALYSQLKARLNIYNKEYNAEIKKADFKL